MWGAFGAFLFILYIHVHATVLYQLVVLNVKEPINN